MATGPVKLQKHLVNGAPNVFADPTALSNGLAGRILHLSSLSRKRQGKRNNFRGDGFFDIDSGLTKSWNITRAAEPEVCVGNLQRHQLCPLRHEHRSLEHGAGPDEHGYQ